MNTLKESHEAFKKELEEHKEKFRKKLSKTLKEGMKEFGKETGGVIMSFDVEFAAHHRGTIIDEVVVVNIAIKTDLD